MSRFLFSLLAVCFVVSCDTAGDGAGGGGTPAALEGSGAKVPGSDLDAAVKSASEGSAAISEGSATVSEATSALTTMASFGTLALASHVGFATLGALLLIGVFFVLLANLVVLPALLAWRRPAAEVKGGRSAPR